MSERPYVVVGGGMAGGRAAEYLAMRGKPAGGVVLVGAEPIRPYHRPVLSKQLLRDLDPTTVEDEENSPEVFFRPQPFYAKRGIQLRLGARATGLDTASRTVEVGGSELGYERLILAPGTAPITLGVPGHDLDGIHYLRTLAEGRAIREGLRAARQVVVVGGGFIGTEVAMACAERGIDVQLVELAPTVLAAALGEQVGELIAQRLRARGVRLRTSARVRGFVGEKTVSGVELDDGTTLSADLVVVGIGVRPDVEWLAGSGLQLSGGLVVDEYCRTNTAGVFGAGDAVRWDHPWFGSLRLEHETNAQNQGMAAARNALGHEHLYRPTPYVWSDQGDLELRYVGHCSQWDDLLVEGGDDGPLSVAYLHAGLVRAVLTVNHPQAYAEADRLMQAEGPFAVSEWSRARISS